MSVWKQIEEAINRQPVAIRLTEREAYVVKEALKCWVDDTIAEANTWEVLQVMTEWGWPWKKKPEKKPPLRSPMTGEGQKAVKSLDPKEVEVIRQLIPNAKARQGETGLVMALSPAEWLRVQKQLEKQPEYFDKMLGNDVTSTILSKKIGDQIASATGGWSKDQPASSEPDLSGKPSDPVDAVTGPQEFGNTPAANIPAGPQYSQEPASQQGDDFDISQNDPSQAAPAQNVPAVAKPKRAPRKKVAKPAAAPAVSASVAAPPAAGAESPTARRARVAKQDMQMMGAKNPEDIKKISSRGRTKVK